MEEKAVAAFFKHDYHDRGLKKWQGYFLSDHTQRINVIRKRRHENKTRQLHEQMNATAISEVVSRAMTKQQQVCVQICEYRDGELKINDLVGKITGLDGNFLRLDNRLLLTSMIVSVALVDKKSRPI
ncbi:hypothetical protein [Fructilactobacillus lindneri]|uniref:hypothetical protein n=1 Tax=Fructilactobacillus lindneri TaxID=53444 RepID=UPI00081C25F0|nr:hypothetical protein [Fructilactobacillus lindneri]SJZ84679.1 hypothetical protein SAMN02746042_00521 [Fructilactobacillus lindneri DSM 20690 = JCM 11027]